MRKRRYLLRRTFAPVPPNFWGQLRRGPTCPRDCTAYWKDAVHARKQARSRSVYLRSTYCGHDFWFGFNLPPSVTVVCNPSLWPSSGPAWHREWQVLSHRKVKQMFSNRFCRNPSDNFKSKWSYVYSDNSTSVNWVTCFQKFKFWNEDLRHSDPKLWTMDWMLDLYSRLMTTEFGLILNFDWKPSTIPKASL